MSNFKAPHLTLDEFMTLTEDLTSVRPELTERFTALRKRVNRCLESNTPLGDFHCLHSAIQRVAPYF